MQNKLLLLLLVFTVNLFAIEGKMRVKVEGDEKIYTSQKVIVSVELLTDAFSISDTTITFPAASSYIVSAPESVTYIRTEDINGTDWQVIRYEYEVYALKAGKIELSSVKTVFSASMGYGQPKKEFTLESGALAFSVRSPKGMPKDKFVLVTDNYILSHTVKPKKSELIVGDALEVEIIQKAHGVPDVLLTPIHYKSTAQLRVYEKEPKLQNGIRGAFDVSRTDRFTFVAAEEGNVTVPAYKSVWWDSKSEKIITETIPAMHFTVIADPQIAIDAKKAQQKKFLLYAVFVVVLLLLLYRLFTPSLKKYMLLRKKQYAMSEKGKFEKLLKSINNDNASMIYKDLYSWLTMISPELSRGGFEAIATLQPSLKDYLQVFEMKLLDDTQPLDTRGFTEELVKLRETLLEKKSKITYGLPKTINPD